MKDYTKEQSKKLIAHYVSRIMDNLRKNFTKIGAKHGPIIGSAVILSIRENMDEIASDLWEHMVAAGLTPDDIEFYEG